MAETIKIVDISKWQGNQIDWALLAKEVDGVIIRAAYGASKDTFFDEHYQEATAHGMKVGAYGYATFRLNGQNIGNPEDNARHEANAIIEITKGKDLPLGIWYDVEFEPNITALPPARITKAALGALEIIRKDRPNDIVGLYGSLAFFRKFYITSQIAEIPKWVAAYGSTKYAEQVSRWDPYIWQYSGSGQLDGCKVKIDLNRLYPDKFPCYSLSAVADAEKKKLYDRVIADMEFYATKFHSFKDLADVDYTPGAYEAAATEIYMSLYKLALILLERVPDDGDVIRTMLLMFGAAKDEDD